MLNYENPYQFFKKYFNAKNIINLLEKDQFAKLIRQAMKKYVEEELDDDKQQYRFIERKDDSNRHLRDITSENKYNNYDNNIAIYIILLSLNNLNKEFHLEKAKVSDSGLILFFEQKLSKNYSGFNISFGIEISNSELRGHALNFRVRHIIKDKDQEKLFTVVKPNPICKIDDSYNIDTAINKIKEDLICGLKEEQKFTNKIISSFKSFEEEYEKDVSKKFPKEKL
ncbi:hypothetical protein [Halanaerocella petrolearia]